MSKENCKKECKIADCERNCPVPDKEQGICAKDGCLYPGECSLKCRSPGTEVRWKCRAPFSFKRCGRRCAHAKDSEFSSDYGHNYDNHHHHDHDHTNYELVNLPKWNRPYDTCELENNPCDDHEDDSYNMNGHTTVSEKTVIAYPSYDPHYIYARMDLNKDKLDDVKKLMKKNNAHNEYQDDLLEEQNILLNHSIGMQYEDAARDQIQMANQDYGYLQRLAMRKGIHQNNGMLHGIKKGQNLTNFKQNVLNNKLDRTNYKIKETNAIASQNAKSLGVLHLKSNVTNAELLSQGQALDYHIHNSKLHDAKLDKLTNVMLDHDAKQDKIGSIVQINGEKLDGLNDGQRITHGILIDHGAQMKKHVSNMNNFVNEQKTFNDYASNKMMNASAHIKDEKYHMKDQKKHMKAQNLHMKYEALHMADAEDHFNHGHHHHDHHHHSHHHEVNHHHDHDIGEIKDDGKAFMVGEGMM
jgi:hypothetical protein